MKITPKILNTVNRASELHDGQARKADGFPFIVHPYSVALIVSDYTDDEDIIVAGLLHDVLEDVKNYGEEKFKKEFGEKIYKIVKQVSEDKDPNENEDGRATWIERKEKYLVHLKNTCFEAMMVCAADKIHNLTSMVEAYEEQGEDLWKKFNSPPDKKLWFYGETLKILKERLDNDIIKELEKAYLEAKRKMNL